MKKTSTLFYLLTFLLLQANAQPVRGTCTPTAATIAPVVCTSYTSPSGNYTWTVSDVYSDTIPNTEGCDSVLTINLTVVGPLSSFRTVTICGGTTYNFHGTAISEPGLYSDTIPGTGGCDSIVTVNLQTNDIINTVTATGLVCTATQNGAGYQWIDCTADTIITGAQNRTYTGVLYGSYRCIIYKGMCTDTTDCITIVPAGIEDAPTVHFGLYPNPTTGSFIIEHTYNGPAQATIFNTLGQAVSVHSITTALSHFNVSNLPAGVYHVAVDSKQERLAVVRFVKE